MSNNKYYSRRSSQHGAALILSMILLLVLTLLGLSSMRTATMEEKMAGNMRDRNLAFEAAESALREGETWINQKKSESEVMSSNFAYHTGELPDLAGQSHTWWTNDANTGEYGITGESNALTEVGDQPRFVIEERASIPDSLVKGFAPSTGKNVFQITARGTGATDTAQSITESTYAKRFN